METLATVVVVDGSVGVELGTWVLGPSPAVATDLDGLLALEQPARINAPAATITEKHSLPLRVRPGISMDARYRPRNAGMSLPITTRVLGPSAFGRGPPRRLCRRSKW